MIEGPYNAKRPGWISEGIAGLELISLIASFFAGCYFIAKAAISFFIADELIKLVVLATCVVALFAVFFIAPQVWRRLAVFAFAALGPLLQYVSG